MDIVLTNAEYRELTDRRLERLEAHVFGKTRVPTAQNTVSVPVTYSNRPKVQGNEWEEVGNGKFREPGTGITRFASLGQVPEEVLEKFGYKRPEPVIEPITEEGGS